MELLFDILRKYGMPVLAIFVGGCVHEYGHALSAKWLGDTTANDNGRLSVNPVVHFDPFWTLILPVGLLLLSGGRFVFGGMKPVPIDPLSMRRPSLGLALSAAAGPVIQVVFAFGVLFVGMVMIPLMHPGSLAMQFIFYAFTANILIAVFNLIPIPPLDGSRILRYLVGPDLRPYIDRFEASGSIILVIVLVYLRVFHTALGWVFGWTYQLFIHLWLWGGHVWGMFPPMPFFGS